MSAYKPVVRYRGRSTELPADGFVEPTRIAATEGSTTPDPGGPDAAGVDAWSTIDDTRIVWDGGAWRVAATQGPGAANYPPIPFSFGDATPKLIAHAAGYLVAVSIVVQTPFNGAGAALQLQTLAGVPLLPASEVFPAEAGRYEANPGLFLAAPTGIQLVITPGSGASAGAGFVHMEIAS